MLSNKFNYVHAHIIIGYKDIHTFVNIIASSLHIFTLFLQITVKHLVFFYFYSNFEIIL